MRLLRMEAVLRTRRGCLGDTEALRRGRGRAKARDPQSSPEQVR